MNTPSLKHPCDYWLGLKLQLLWSYRLSRSKKEASSIGLSSSFEHTSCWFIEEGRATIETADEVVTAGPGEWLIPPTGERTQSFEGPLKMTSITFLARWRSGHHLYPMKQSHICPSDQAEGLKEQALNLIQHTDGLASGDSWYLGIHETDQSGWLKIQQAFHLFLEEFGAFAASRDIPCFHPVSIDSRFAEAKRLIDRAALSEQLDIKGISEQVGLSRRQLERLFHQEIGISPSRSFELRKIEAIRWALGSGDFKLKEAASLLGFTRQANFNRWFLRNFGVTPSRYREQQQSQK